jgi:hypothetical protein
MFLLLGCSVFVIGLGIVLFYNKQHSQVVSSATPLTTTNRRYLEQAVSSDTVAEQSQALSAVIRQEFKKQGKPLLPAGATLTIRSETFQAGKQIAQAEALAGAARYTVHFVLEDGTWRILFTEKHP